MGWIEELYYKEQALKSKDFYYENGNRVMTSSYHERRGYCCGNGCRHCPYYPKIKKGEKPLKTQ